jgi:ElaA protein
VLVNWCIKSFEQLTSIELYAILKLRSDVFIKEQNCVFPDVDGNDPEATHIFASDASNNIVAYCRIVSPGVSYAAPSIGRVVLSAAVRKHGIGKDLMRKAIAECHRLYAGQPITIGAQTYLTKFYAELGFAQTSETYIEDGIAHVKMTLGK